MYAEKCVKAKFFKDREDSISKVKAYIKRKLDKGDWYMTSEEATNYGFIDGIYK